MLLLKNMLYHTTNYRTHVTTGLGYVTVLEKTKYSTIARRMLLLATATNIKSIKRGLILVNRSVEFESKLLHIYCHSAVCYET